MKHGTRIGYRRHREAGEDACQPCKDANAAYGRQYRESKGYKVHSHAHAAPDTIVDVMSTYEHWFTIEALIGRVQYHRPDLSEAAIRRALVRLQDAGRVRARAGLGGVEYFCDEWSACAS